MKNKTTFRPGFRLFSLVIVLAFLSSLLRPDLILAQEKETEAALTEARHFYELGKYQEALDGLVALISGGREFEPHLMVEIYKYLAFCNSAFGNQDLAKKQFKRAMRYDPSLKLDPVFVSPKIMEIFEKAKEEFFQEQEVREVKEQKAGKEKMILGKGLFEVSADVVDARVYLNGEERGTIPMPAPLELAAGKYRVRVSKEGYYDFESMVEITPGEKQVLRVGLKSREMRKPWYKKGWVWALVAVGAGGAAAALALSGRNKGEDGDYAPVTIHY